MLVETQAFAKANVLIRCLMCAQCSIGDVAAVAATVPHTPENIIYGSTLQACK